MTTLIKSIIFPVCLPIIVGCSAEVKSSSQRPVGFNNIFSQPDKKDDGVPDASSAIDTGDNRFSIDAGNNSPPVIDSAVITPIKVNNPVPAQTEVVCEEVRVVATRAKVDMMIVLDRSESMRDESRWEPSIAAVRSVTQQLDECVRLGISLFPDSQSTGSGSPFFDRRSSCTPGSVNIPIGDANAMAISDLLNVTQPGGGTPTSETLQSVLNSFMANTTPGQIRGAQYVLLVTDGQPTCPAGGGRNVTQEDIDASYSAIEQLAVEGIKSYVIGYDTTGEGREELAAVLDGLAQRGGTGDAQHRPVEDEESLVSELQSITGEIIECGLVLDTEPPGPEYVKVTLDGRELTLDNPDGWQFEPPQSVILVGNSCELIKDCRQHAIDVDILCEPVN